MLPWMLTAAESMLKEHEQQLLRTFLSVLLDDSEPEDLVTLLFWQTNGLSADSLLSFGEPQSPQLLSLKEEVLRWVADQNRPVVLDNGVGVLGRMQAAVAAAGLRSAAIFPLAYQGSPIGSLLLGRRRGPSPFVFLDSALVTLFGTIINGIFESLHCFRDGPANNRSSSTSITAG